MTATTPSTRRTTVPGWHFPLAGMTLIVGSLILAACSSSPSDQAAKPKGRDIRVVAAENEYGNVASQIGGRYVSVTSVESNPNTDPHSYEVSPGVAQAVSS